MTAIDAQGRALLDQQALKLLVDTFSNLADEKRVEEQMQLFTADAQVTTYIGGQLFGDARGRDQIGKSFSDYLALFHTVYHHNGQFVPTLGADSASAIHYCQVMLVGEQAGQNLLTTHAVRYQDDYVKSDGRWLIARRVAHFVITETRELGVA